MFSEEIKIVDTFETLGEAKLEIQKLMTQLEEVSSKLKKALDLQKVSFVNVTRAMNCYSGDVDTKTLLQTLDSALWSQALTLSGIERFVTHKDKEDLRKRYRETPPPFTAHQARALVDQLQNSQSDVALLAVRKVFEQVTNAQFRVGNHYRNERQKQCGHKIEKSFRVSLFFGGIPSYYVEDDRLAFLNDLELVCCLVNAQTVPEYPGKIGDAIKSALREKTRSVSCEHFTVQFFKNGNAKIEFASQDTVDLLNKWGADHTKLTSKTNRKAKL